MPKAKPVSGVYVCVGVGMGGECAEWITAGFREHSCPHDSNMSIINNMCFVKYLLHWIISL